MPIRNALQRATTGGSALLSSNPGLRLEVAHALAAAAQALALELAAGGEDVAAARRADGRAQAARVHDLGEARRLIGQTARVKLIEGAAEQLPFGDRALDFVVSSFLLHELPADVRVAALAEMARVLKPDGLVVIVDSIQRGDRPAWDGLLDLFPHYFHEPYYAEYANGRLSDWAENAGLAVVANERAFLSSVTTLRPA